jgi:hypothetical protein
MDPARVSPFTSNGTKEEYKNLIWMFAKHPNRELAIQRDMKTFKSFDDTSVGKRLKE